MNSLLQRMTGILFAPNAEWPVVAAESANVSGLFVRYVMPLALIPALAHLVGSWLIGGYATLPSAAVSAGIGYGLGCAAVFVVAMIADALAPRFESRRNYTNAFKLAAYSCTPVWLAGIFLLVPGLSFLTVLGLYGVYLLWLGLPPLMRTPFAKSAIYAVAVVACALLLAVGTALLQATMLGGTR